jgi:16S rRNA (cytidine1402-2'-O)-methyltransferase
VTVPVSENGVRPTGILFVVATPIGNLDDITIRAARTLEQVDFIACEDTRRTRILLERLKIKTQIVSLHRFSERERTEYVIQRLLQGESCALVCDAGTPNIADPGALLIREVHKKRIRVIPIPGPSSVVAALSISGIDCSSFSFRGFVPKKTREREAFFRNISSDSMPCIIFESPKRILASLLAAQDILGDRSVVLVRELTKVHEEVLRGSAAEIAETLSTRGQVKGEICVIIDSGRPVHIDMDAREAVSILVKEGFTGKKLAQEAHNRFGLRKSLAYSAFLALIRADKTSA